MDTERKAALNAFLNRHETARKAGYRSPAHQEECERARAVARGRAHAREALREMERAGKLGGGR